MSKSVEILGHPDSFTVKLGSGETIEYYYSDSKAYPFIIHNGKLHIGERGETHGVLKSIEHIPQGSGEEIVEGRIWVGAKSNDFNYAVVAFWGMAGIGENNNKPQVEELVRKLKVNPNKVVIIVSDEDWSGMLSTAIPLANWDGKVKFRTEEEERQKNLHMMSAEEKRKETGGFRKSRDKRIGEKLTNDKGEEMPMAKYHSMIYQEGKEVIISEDQFNRLFNC